MRFIYFFILVKDGGRWGDILYSFLPAHPSPCTYIDLFLMAALSYTYFSWLIFITNDKPIVYSTAHKTKHIKNKETPLVDESQHISFPFSEENKPDSQN